VASVTELHQFDAATALQNDPAPTPLSWLIYFKIQKFIYLDAVPAPPSKIMRLFAVPALLHRP
jgi:hypothetical protein